jgi:hypothetical protein
MQRQPIHHRATTAVQLGFLGLIVIFGLNYEAILDQYALTTYHPVAQLSSFESRVGLTAAAKATLYRATPKFDGKTTFNSDCDTKPHELELGCYFHGRIFVLTIDNPSLAPEMDVVSAHELLHAVWAKMSASERASLTPELEQAYHAVGDKDLTARMADYATSEPGEEANELHSILATEYTGLSPVLEAHYAKYFTQRSQVVARHAQYQSVFDSRRVELEKELATIRSEKANLGSINRQLEAYRSSGQIQAYNALVPRQNNLVDTINKQIETYRTGVDEYNGLSKSLDSQQITDTETSAQ